MLAELHDVHKHFKLTGGRLLQAVRGVSLSLQRGETLGLVGESGCGKSTLARCLLRLSVPTSGRVIFDGHDLAELGARELASVRRRLQIVFQDPTTSLNPRLRVGAALGEPLRVHRLVSRAGEPRRVQELLEQVGLAPEYKERFPHQLSGGERQRVGIARALSVNPELIVADEPTSSLDVSIQAQVVNLLLELQRSLHLAYLFISHDLHLVAHVSDRLAIMYAGRIVEEGAADAVLDHPRHPYTRALLGAAPGLQGPGSDGDGNGDGDGDGAELIGEPPSPISVPKGCAFHPRCPVAVARCSQEAPEPRAIEEQQRAECHLA